MTRAITFLKGMFHTFGGLILYWATLLAFGVKPAIAAALAFIVIEGGWRLATRRPFPPLWVVMNGAAIVFGAIDLWAQTPFMVRYEGTVINLGFAAAFAIGAFGREPVVMQFARQRSPDIPSRPEYIRYFRAFSIAWSLYFVLRAAAFLWIMVRYPLVEALAIRTVAGWVSIGVMMLISFNGRLAFQLCQRLGFFLPAKEPQA